MTPEASTGTGVRVAGEGTVTVADTPAARDRFGWDERAFTIRCHTGRVTEGRWAGFPVAALTAAASFPPETTHLRVTARDGHRTHVAVGPGLDALLGFERVAVSVTGGEVREESGTPRFLASGLDPATAVREVATIEAVSVPAGEDPEAYEPDG